MLGIIIAMQTECNELMKSGFQDVFCQIIQNQKFYIVKTKNNESAIISFSGIGKTNASMVASLMINNFNIKYLLNIGSCGIYQGVNILETVIINQLSYSDVDVTPFGYEINQVPKMPLYYETDHKLNIWLKKWMQINNEELKFAICYSADSFINNKNYKRYNIIDSSFPIVIDMEACSIAQVCYCLKTNFICIKIGIDKLFEPITNQEQFNKNLGLVANKIDEIVINLIDMFNYSFKQRKD